MSDQVSIIMLSHNLGDVTARCLRALAASTEYRPVELIWVDNGSNQVERDIAEAALLELPFDFTTVYLEENRGWCGGCAAGLEVADPESDVVLLNNDTRPTPGWLTAMVRALSAPDVGIVGALTENGQQWQSVSRLVGKWPELRDAPLDQRLPGWLAENLTGQVRPVGAMVAFFAALLRREMIERIGFLDPDFGLGLADDDEYCERARRTGWRIVIALDSFVYHDHRTTFTRMAESGLDVEALRRHNMAIWRLKRVEATGDYHPDSVFRYLGRNGSPYITGIPARDLDARDLAELATNGITRADIVRSGIYVETYGEDILGNIGPFCGAPLENGERCMAFVGKWGEQCALHRDVEMIPLHNIRGIGTAIERALQRLEITDVKILADLTDRQLQEMLTDLPRVSERQLFEWRAAAKKMIGRTRQDGTQSI